jgi:MoaA/NifB/PqqE/SkfB family radical SAM enzyme
LANRIKSRRLELHISYACGNNCIFCSENNQLNRFKDIFVNKDTVFETLGKATGEGISHVSFTGGEPTLHPDLVEILMFAKSCGLKTYLSSNGSSFASKSFCRRVLPYIDEVCLSIHGPYARIHNTHTSNPESFKKLKSAFINIENSPNPVTMFSNTVITPYNINFLIKIAEFVSQFNRLKQILFSLVAPDGNGMRHFYSLTPRLGSIIKLVPDLSFLCKEKSIALKFFGIPLCALRGYERLSNDLYWSPRTTFELWKNSKANYYKKTKSLRPTRNRLKVHFCRSCIRKDLCGGIFKQYAHIITHDKISPYIALWPKTEK